MMTIYETAGSCLARRDGAGPISASTVWIDLHNPDPAEEADIEKALGLDVPTRAEMREIEVSNRFYS
ncbi:MAG: magnesium transporter CorA, partial [Hyphomicrobium sp.]